MDVSSLCDAEHFFGTQLAKTDFSTGLGRGLVHEGHFLTFRQIISIGRMERETQPHGV